RCACFVMARSRWKRALSGGRAGRDTGFIVALLDTLFLYHGFGGRKSDSRCVERLSLSVRMHLRRFARRTKAHSRKLENLDQDDTRDGGWNRRSYLDDARVAEFFLKWNRTGTS